MKFKAFIVALALLFVTDGEASAEGTSIGFAVSRGESDTTSYSLSINQVYSPLISGALGELTPTAQLAGHYWYRKRSDDSVWVASLAPGLRFSMFTNGYFNPFIAGSLGVAVASDRDIGPRDLGSNVMFQTKGALGVDFGESHQHRIQGEYTNYSNWGMCNTDDGYSTVGGSYSYAF